MLSGPLLYAGCVIPSRLPFVEAAAAFVMGRMGDEVRCIPGAGCCIDPVGLASLAPEARGAAAGDLRRRAGERSILALCEGCNFSLSTSAECSGSTIGFLEYLDRSLERIGGLVESPLGLRLAVFPGCHAESTYASRGASAPEMMERVLRALGADPRHPSGGMCCGGGVSGVDDALSRRILDECVNALDSTGADAIVTSCPFCFLQFDLVARRRVFHIAELAASALGWREDASKYHRS